MQKFKFFTLAIITMLSVNLAWGVDPTITEDFEKQDAGTTYNEQVTYEASSSNAEIGWFVEHGTVSETAKLSGTKSMHMRAYYAKNSVSGTWNGVLPYTNTTTAIKGLKSVSFSIAVSNTGLKYDTYYSTNGSTWTAIQTAQTLSGTSATTKSFVIPNSDANTSYYIKIGANSGSTHANKPSSAGNYTFRIDDVVFTYADEPSCEEPEVAKYDGTCQTNTNYNLEENCFLSDNTSAITFTCTSSNKSSCTISGSTFRATAAGTYTIKATQAEDGTYCAVEETFNVVVTAPTCYVTFLNNGQPISGTGIDDQGRKQYHEGDQLGELPTLDEDDACDATSKHFMGWTSDAGFQKRAAPPSSFVSASTPATDGMILRAVWARAQ